MRLRDAHARDIPGRKQKFDYGARTDGQPVYYGQVSMEDGDDSKKWVIHYFQYDGDGYVTEIQCLEGTWTGRAALFA